jgi:hypothetical protein
MTTLREKSIKDGANGHARYVIFQMADVAIPQNPFVDILRLIAEPPPPPSMSTGQGVVRTRIIRNSRRPAF